jgi:large subunit ribosomal protein L29
VKISEIKEHSTEELQNLLEELRRRLFDLRSQAVTEKLEDPSQLGKTKKDIARVLTTLRSRDVANLESKMHHLEKSHVAAKKK